MAQTRTKNTVRNSAVGILSYVITSLMSFVSRTVFIKVLGVEYLGISGLYSNILTMLSLTDMGLVTVMIYSLYKPLAENDIERVESLIRYFKRLYNIIAGVVAIVGVAMIPVLPYVVKGSALSYGELVRYYLLILLNNVCSYFAVSKTTLIKADQQMSTVQLVTCICNIALHGVQIVLLLILKNYTVFLIAPIAFTLLSNLILSVITTRRYPYLKKKNNVQVEDEIKVYIKKNLKSTFVYKLSASIINSTDNILISVMLGVTVVGYYSNYMTVVALVNSVISILIQGVIASLGSYNSSQPPARKYAMFKIFSLAFYAVGAFCAACYLSVFSDFINVWIGSEFILSNLFLWSLVFNNFVSCISNPIWMTRETTGLFKESRYVMLCAAVINLGLSILLGKFIGLAGIIFATGIARLLTMYWYEPFTLCKKVFEIPFGKYWVKIFALLLASAAPIVVGWLLQGFPTQNIFLMLAKIVLCALATLLSFVLFFFKTEEFKSVKSKILNVLKKQKHSKGETI